MKKWLASNWFMLGIAAAVAVGFTFPEVAAANPSGISSDIIVMLMFLGIGFTLPSEAIRSGFSNWRLHVFLQGFIFLLIPGYMLLATSILPFSPEMRIGLLALSVLPTTVSTAIVFTQSAGGNVIGTMFNSALSNIAGVFVSPLLLSLLLRQAGTIMPMSVLAGIIGSLLWKMILPMLIGQILHLRFKKQAKTAKKPIGKISNVLILLIVLLSVAKSAGNPEIIARAGQSLPVALFLAASFYILLALATAGSSLAGFNDSDKISIAYAAPQKTLAMGVPLLSAYFSSDPDLLGLALLPVLFYHPWQILNAGVIRMLPFSRRVSAEERH